MKKLVQWLGGLLMLAITVVIIGIIYINSFLPNVGEAPSISIALTPERVVRGDYLANNVAVCLDCHSTRDWTKFAGPLVKGSEGAGRERFDRTMGFPGVFYAKNITPYGVGDWTDGELYRAITSGVSKDGEPLFPLMPYHYFGKMAKEDIYSIIAYLRTLPSVKTEVQKREIDFPFSLVLRTIPTQANHVELPQKGTAAYGGYLVGAAACRECHTKDDKGQIITELQFGGGRQFEFGGGTLVSSNLTPHETGLGSWSRAQFIARFINYQDSSYISPTIDFSKEYNTIMPWMMFSKMSEEDLGAIYEYLMTLPPIDNATQKWIPKTN